jgi:uncharacterized protein (TIGR02231 family)
MKTFLSALLALCCITGIAQDTAKTDAKLIAATVYYGYGAELTHEAKVNFTGNLKQIVISQLSTAIDENSLQISVPENVALLSYKYSVYYPAAPTVINPLTKPLQDSLTLINTELRRNNNKIFIEEQTLEKTGKMIETVINNSGNKTVSSAEALKLIDAYTAKIEKANKNIFDLKEIEISINSRIAAMEKKISETGLTTAKPPKPYGQIILQVMSNSTGELPISFSYFTNTAGWTPLYDIRVNSKTNEIKLVYKASVTQSTGIDWKQTKLTLSTGNPTLGGTAPILNAWNLQLYVPPIYAEVQNTAAQARNSIQSTYDKDGRLKEVVVTALGIKRQEKELGYSTTTIDPSELQKYVTLNESQLNTNFEIDLPYDIESDGQLHAVTIKSEKINAFLKNYAVPKLDKDAYLLAEVSDWQNLDLLPGAANIIMDNTYLGKSFIDPNNTGDTLNLTLGKDRRVAVKRTVVKDFTSTKTSGNTTKQTFTYEVIVKNNKLTAVDLLLKDQFPISTIKDIEVKLEDDGGAAINEDVGVLTWKLQLKPGESTKLRFSYSVKYPKDKKVANL